MTERLNRAMKAGDAAICDLPKAGWDTPLEEQRKVYAQALIADFLKPDPPYPHEHINDDEPFSLGASFDYGWGAYEHMLHVRAGLRKDDDYD